MNKNQRELIQYMQMVSEVYRQNYSGFNGYAYCGAEDFLLQCGRWYRPQPLPERIQPMTIKQCYANALILAAHHHKAYRYVEGIAYAIIPTQHAWCTDKRGNVIDPTWQKLGHAYCGVEFGISEVRKALRNGTTMLDNWAQRHPLFRTAWQPRFTAEWGKSFPKITVDTYTNHALYV